jgi:hypothetical protein
MRLELADAVGAHRLVDVLEGLPPEVAYRGVDAVANLILHRGRHANAARRRQAFKPRGDVDAIA